MWTLINMEIQHPDLLSRKDLMLSYGKYQQPTSNVSLDGVSLSCMELLLRGNILLRTLCK
jgi:hypothetical protein